MPLYNIKLSVEVASRFIAQIPEQRGLWTEGATRAYCHRGQRDTFSLQS
jgi:hypothetical protein